MIKDLLFLLLVPAVVIWLCGKNKFLGKIGPILVLFGIGIIASNLGFFSKDVGTIQEILTSACIPLAIPLMLFSTNLKTISIKKSSIYLITGLLSITLMIILGFVIFKDSLLANPMIGEDAAKITALLSGMYTGGNINIAALQMMLKVPEKTYILINSYDIIINLVYLIFLLTIGIKLFRLILDKKTRKTDIVNNQSEAPGENYKDIFSKKQWRSSLAAIGLAIGIAGVSAGLSFLFTGEINMTIVILSLTTFSLVASSFRPIREIKSSFSTGMYLILTFSITIASMSDFREFDFSNGLKLLYFMGFMIFGSLVIQLILSRIFKVDADSMVITSVALINSPPFVPMMCSVMKNKGAMVTGLTIGTLGYAIGNYYGYLIYLLLTWLS